ncbi:MAG: beta-propeller domain-containing protein [Cyanobacteriota bacterium]|nr:beta-propeller domain-containing protein [Cyanobacteriota bacterium]
MTQNSPSRSIDQFNSEDQLKTYLVEDALEKYSDLFGQETSYGYYPFDVTLNSTIFAETDITGTSTVNFSETNTQEQGVDEADLVETNGEYIYQVTGQTLTIVDARNSEQLTLASETDLKDLGSIEGAYLYNDQLTIISTTFPWQIWSGRLFPDSIPFPSPTVNVTVLDVSDPTSIEIEETSSLDGYLLSSRAIDDQVYVVTQDSFGLPTPELKLKEGELTDSANEATLSLSSGVTTSGFTSISGSITGNSTDGLTVSASISGSSSDLSVNSSSLTISPGFPQQTYIYETEEEYLERIESQELELALPEFTTVDDQGNILREGLLNEAENIYKPLDENPFNMASVSVFDVDDNQAGPNSSTGIPTNNLNELYMSLDNLYLLKNNWWQTGQTGLLKVDLESLDLVATGEVPGRVLDQFSVDEEGGFLRVATTTGFGTNAENNVYVLEQDGETLETVGSIEGIAPGETIQSARFEGDYGFLVTFVQIDPFFTLDLSTPTNPQIAGELKLPGFSEYLQVIENAERTQVLGIGREFNDLKISLFDATDFDNPEEVDSYIFEGQYSSSEAQWDPQAVGYFPEFDTLAIPFRTSNGEQGMRVFDVDAEEGFSELGDITHDGEQIRRSLVIDDELYAISNDRVTVHDIQTLELVDEIILPESDDPVIGFPIDPLPIDPLPVEPWPILTTTIDTSNTFNLI